MEARLPFTGDSTGSESRMPHADPATSPPPSPAEVLPPTPAAVQAQGNLWNEFLRRNLLLAGLASAGSLRRAEPRDQGATDAR